MTTAMEEIVSLNIEPSEPGGYTIRLLGSLYDDEPYVLDCKNKGFVTEGGHWRRSIDAGYVSQLLRNLAEARIPAIPECVDGLDGADYELILTQGRNTVTYRWWCDLTKGYEPVAQFANELLRAAGIDIRVDCLHADAC